MVKVSRRAPAGIGAVAVATAEVKVEAAVAVAREDSARQRTVRPPMALHMTAIGIETSCTKRTFIIQLSIIGGTAVNFSYAYYDQISQQCRTIHKLFLL